MNAIEISYCVVKEWNVVTVRLTKEGAERVHRLQGEGRTFCLACELPLGKIGDKEQRTVCGVHESCDQTQRHAVEKGHCTFAELIKAGERRAPGVRGVKPKTDYAAKLLGRKKKGS